MRRLSRLAQEPASRWIDRIKSWQTTWNDRGRKEERTRYRRALSRNDFGTLVPWAGSADGDQIVTNLLELYERRVKAMGFDESPEGKWPRDRKGAERFAEAVDRLMIRETERAGLPMLTRRGITLLCTDGAFALYAGVEKVYTRESVIGAGKGMEEIKLEAEAGAHEATPGQDSQAIAQVLVDDAQDPAQLLAKGPEVAQAKFDAAAQHLKILIKEGKTEQHDLDAGRIYNQILVYGRDFARDSTVMDPWDGRFMARRILLTEEEAHTSELLDPACRGKLPARVPSDGSGPMDVSSLRGDVGEDAKRVEVWEVFDAWYRVRHIVCEGFDNYCEVSDEYPYLDKGKPGLRGFFPFALCEPHVGVGDSVADCLPTPLFRSGWHKQIEYIKIDSHICQAIKRATVDKYVAHPMMTDAHIAALTNGRPGGVVKGVEGVGAKEALVAIDFRPPIAEAINERKQILYDFAFQMRIPIADLTGQPIADTVGQEEIAMASGSVATADIIKMLQVWYADAMFLDWRLVQLTYPEELIGQEAGMQFVQSALPPGMTMDQVPQEMFADALALFAQQVKSGPLAWEKPVVRFGATSKDSDPVRVKQLQEFGTWVFTTLGPLALPAYIGIVQESARALGLGDLPLGDITPETLLAQQGAQAGGPTNENGEPKTESGDQAAPDRESVRKNAKQSEPVM